MITIGIFVVIIISSKGKSKSQSGLHLFTMTEAMSTDSKVPSILSRDSVSSASSRATSPSAAAAAASSSTASVKTLFKGLLSKKRGGFGRMSMQPWVERLFTLSSDGNFSYCDLDYPEIVRGRADLFNTKIEVFSEHIEGAPHPYCLKIKMIEPSDESWNLCAQDKQQFEEWMKYFIQFQNKNGNKKIKNRQSMKGSPQSVMESPTQSANMKNKSLGTSTATNISHENSKRKKGFTKKKPFRIVKNNSSLISSDMIEFICILLILNFCIFGVIESVKNSDNLLSILYVVILNFAVMRTLNIRGNRVDANLKIISKKEEEKQELIEELQRREEKQKEKEDDDDDDDDGDNDKNIKSDIKPEAGSTFKQVSIEEGASATVSNCWCKADHRLFVVRDGPNYNVNKQKKPSEEPIYEPFALDAFCSSHRLDHITPRMKIPDEYLNMETNHDW